ncbi:MAG TPA: lipid II flippase MurJ, partial [Alphaproteobacteria bacterium]|nr:lipid II flippase MurJ [Alphaproteobacteria bacterium]
LDQRNKTRLPRILGSAIGLGAALWAGNWLLAPWLGNSMEAIRIAALALLVSGGGAVYFACAILSGGLTLADLRKAFRRG